MSTRRRRSAHAIVALSWALSLATAACAPVTTPPRAPVPFPTTWPAEMKEAIDDLPRVMPYRAKAPVLPGYHLEGRPQVPLILCGAGAFAFLYGLTALEGQDGRIPIAGPILIIAGREKPTEGLLVAFSYVYAVIYAMDSVLQVAGLGMIVGGFASPTKVQVKDAPARESKGPFFRLDPRGPALVF